MKKSIIICLFCSVLFPNLHARDFNYENQSSEYDFIPSTDISLAIYPGNIAQNTSDYKYNSSTSMESLYLAKKGKKLRGWGIGLTSFGCAIVVGCVVAEYVDPDVPGRLATGCYVAAPFLASGIPLWVSGSRKIHRATSAYSYAPVIEVPIEFEQFTLVPSVWATKDRLTDFQSISAGLAFKF